MIDSHCHLDHEPLFNNLDDIIKRSKDIKLESIATHNHLKVGTHLNKIGILFKKIEKSND